MKAVINFLSDIRVSPQEFASTLMRESPDVQESFILFFITYLSSLSKRTIYHDEVAHLIEWSRDALEALDNID